VFQIWFQYQHNGRQIKRTAGTRNWETAARAARKLEHELHLSVGDEVPPAKPLAVTVESAVQQDLKLRQSEGLKPSTIRKIKAMMRKLRSGAEHQNILFLKNLTPLSLLQWRSEWPFLANSYSLKVHNAIPKAFFKWALDMELIPRDPYVRLKAIAVDHRQTMPFSEGKMEQRLKNATARPRHSSSYNAGRD
jgi:hypothetical protein